MFVTSATPPVLPLFYLHLAGGTTGTLVDLRKYVANPDVTTEERLPIFKSGRPGQGEECVGYVRARAAFKHSVQYLLC